MDCILPEFLANRLYSCTLITGCGRSMTVIPDLIGLNHNILKAQLYASLQIASRYLNNGSRDA
jgi:ribosomal protein S19